MRQANTKGDREMTKETLKTDRGIFEVTISRYDNEFYASAVHEDGARGESIHEDPYEARLNALLGAGYRD